MVAVGCEKDGYISVTIADAHLDGVCARTLILMLMKLEPRGMGDRL